MPLWDGRPGGTQHGRFELAWEHGSGSLRTILGPLPRPFVVLWRVPAEREGSVKGRVWVGTRVSWGGE